MFEKTSPQLLQSTLFCPPTPSDVYLSSPRILSPLFTRATPRRWATSSRRLSMPSRGRTGSSLRSCGARRASASRRRRRVSAGPGFAECFARYRTDAGFAEGEKRSMYHNDFLACYVMLRRSSPTSLPPRRSTVATPRRRPLTIKRLTSRVWCAAGSMQRVVSCRRNRLSDGRGRARTICL